MTIIQEILIELQSMGHSQASIERTLGLPMKTLDNENPETLALMKMIKAFPWLLQVADRQFDEFESKRILGHAAVDAAVNKAANEKLKQV